MRSSIRLQMTTKQATDLEASLKRFNLVEIPAINTDGMIIAGHQRINILTVLGRGDEDIEDLGEWDWAELTNFDTEMLLDVGFDENILENIFLDLHDEDKRGMTSSTQARGLPDVFTIILDDFQREIVLKAIEKASRFLRSPDIRSKAIVLMAEKYLED